MAFLTGRKFRFRSYESASADFDTHAKRQVANPNSTAKAEGVTVALQLEPSFKQQGIREHGAAAKEEAEKSARHRSILSDFCNMHSYKTSRNGTVITDN
jgi:hypothetical protein